MQAFLEALYGDLPEGAWFYLWTLNKDTKVTHWFQDIGQAVELARTTSAANVYWPIGFRSENGSPNERGEEGSVAGIVALVCDVDLKDETHPYAPETDEDALVLVESFPLRPTACVHSGHGLQAAWLFREPWVFDNDAERLQAKQLSANWWHTLAALASRKSYELDAVHDLTRVMRVPSTVNCKKLPPVPVRLLWLEDARYNPQDFDQYLVEMPAASVAEPMPTIDLRTPFPTEKHGALCANFPEFEQTWLHKRKMPRDNSCSGYDMSLASFTVRAGWSDDEIAALLQEHQRKWGDKSKPDKVNDAAYFARTICNARKGARVDTAREAAEAIILSDNGLADRDARLQAVATRLEVPLTHVQLVTGDPAVMRLWIGGKCMEVAAIALDTPKAFMQALISTARFYPVPVGQKERPGWREIVNVLLSCAEEVEAGVDATVEGEFRGIVRGFLEGRGVVECPEGELVKSVSNPFLRGERIWVRIDDLAQYIRVFGSRMERRTIVQRLKTMGAENRPHKVNGRSKGSVKAVRFYGLPAADFGDEM